MNVRSQSEEIKDKTVVSHSGSPPLSMADFTFNSLPCELDDNCWEELMGNNLYQSPLLAEEINNYMMSWGLVAESEEETSLMVDDIFIADEDIFLTQQIPTYFGSQPPKICAHVQHGEKEEEVELIQLLLASGRMIGEGKCDHAARLISKCNSLSSQVGNPTERLAYYISGALQDRIQLETFGIVNSVDKPISDYAFNIHREIEQKELCSLVAYSISVLPYNKLLQFTSVQAIIDTVGNARKIHVIDLGMRSGSHWTVLMEYLAHRAVSSSLGRLELLRLTAVGMNGKELRESGKRLHDLARSFGIPLLYNVVEIKNIEEIKEGLLTVKSGEALAVYSSIVLRSLLYDPALLDNLLRVIKKLKPRIMVNVEVEAQHNSPSFLARFKEVLFYYMAYFDLMDVTMTDRNHIKRVKHEELFSGSQMRNMIVCEGKERSVRHVRTDVWRSLFKQAGFRETSFSFQAMYQARLLLREYASGKYYILEPCGHAIIVKWKGTPLFSVSAWCGIK